MMSKEIVLNCVSPCDNMSPSPALSILKAYLLNQNMSYDVKVVYWNIILFKLETDFIWNKNLMIEDLINSTIIYAAYLAVKTNNKALYNDVKAILQTFLPIMLNEKDFFDEHIKKYTDELDKTIDSYLDTIDFNNVLCFGFTMKMYEWAFAAVLAEKIKKRAPHMPVVVGGISTAKEAKAFLDNFKQFDFAIWGEGEIPLLQLTQFLSNNEEYNVERSFYRENGVVKASSNKSYHFLDLSTKDLFPDFDDYFYFLKKHSLKVDDILLIEGARGCHWNKCHFCYLNEGYKYRQKSIDKIVQEVKYLIARHNIYRFKFLDNDTVGKDFNHFNKLLNALIKLKKEYPNLIIVGAELITLGLTAKIIKKIFRTGTMSAQVGYESAGNNLLKKIDKKNTFASNLNTIKLCLETGIRISGANVIRNLLEETDEDVLESIENLRFFRFIFNSKKGFIHSLIDLQVNASSKYYKSIINKKQEYKQKTTLLLCKSYMNNFDEDTLWTFFDFQLPYVNPKWDLFKIIQNHYLKNSYQHKFVYKKDKIIYIESFNNEEIENIEFEYNSAYILILYNCYSRVVSMQELTNIINKVKIEELKEKIDFLFSKGLVYRTPCYDEIVSIVKIKKVSPALNKQVRIKN